MDRRASRGAIGVGAAATSSAPAPVLAAKAYDFGKADRLARELGLLRPTAVALLRRGIEDPERARSFLGEGEIPAPELLGGVEETVRRLLAARDEGRRITVYGDFDVDGVCGTAILVAALRACGAECDWYIPDRVSEGYGLNTGAIERLATRGTGLLITVDCGITAVAEAAAARRLGLEVIVTDHHQAGEQLPDCLIVHPRVSGYSCPDLCGAAVAWKLASALRRAAGSEADGDADLDLVALATVADLVPLTGENRTLVKHGLRAVRRASRPGMRALIEAAACPPAGIDEGDLGFKLAPRINAAGRLYRADAGVELFLSEDPARAAEIAAELNRANQERRDVELRVLGEAESSLREQRVDGDLPAGLVVSGSGWHPGVIGIVASRLVELHRRPAVVIAVDEQGGARGSGRGVNGFDLLAALDSCAAHLGRYGGHRAAAGLELAAERIPAFAAAFAAATAEQLGPVPGPIRERVDAFAAGPELGLPLAEELALLAPFGIGNPGVNLVIPSARVGDVSPMGDGGAHLRFTVHSGGHRARAVAFARQSLGCDEAGCADLVMRLERNEWNGSVEPRLRLREIIVLQKDGGKAARYSPHCPDDEWWHRFEQTLASAAPEGAADTSAPAAATASLVGHEPGTGMAVLAELLTSGAPVLAVCADAGRRFGLAEGPAGVGRFSPGPVAVASWRDGEERFRATLAAGFGLTDYRSLLLWAEQGADRGRPDRHVALIDPPATPEEIAIAAAAATGTGAVHRLWDEAARSFALKVLTENHELRQPLARIYRALRDHPGDEPEALRARLEGEGGLPLGPETTAFCVAILAELGLVDVAEGGQAGPDVCARRLRAVSSNRTELQRSRLYQGRRQQYEVKAKFLRSYR